MRTPLVLLTLLNLCLPLPAVVRPLRTAKSPPRGVAAVRKTASPPARKSRAVSSRSPWKQPTFAESTADDNVDGEDLTVRLVAVGALGQYNGSVVVTDADTGRILSIVNQKLALSNGYQPCSTIKLVTALAALEEKLIPRSGPSQLTGKALLNLTGALAHSSNYYFAVLGRKLEFSRVTEYARLLGLGERAGRNIEGEMAGVLPSAPPGKGGIGMMTSYGTGISLTPLQLAALVGAVANGGTLYYLQYPRSAAEAAGFTPRIKRELPFGGWLDELKLGMRAAVERGTARRAARGDEPVHGKTGTCTDFGKSAHMGWFGSFSEVGERKLVVVVMLTGARGVSGPVASEIAGRVYAGLARRGYSVRASRPLPPPNS